MTHPQHSNMCHNLLQVWDMPGAGLRDSSRTQQDYRLTQGPWSWIKLLLTTHQNLLLRFRDAAAWIHHWLTGAQHPLVPQPLLARVPSGVLAGFGRQLGSVQIWAVFTPAMHDK